MLNEVKHLFTCNADPSLR